MHRYARVRALCALSGFSGLKYNTMSVLRSSKYKEQEHIKLLYT